MATEKLPSLSMDLISFFQNTISGLLIGMVYALIGVGLTIIFGVMRTINFAHGDFVVLGMYSAVLFNSITGLDPYFTVLLVLPVGLVFGALIQRLLLERVINAPAESTMLVTLGLSLVIANLLLLSFGGEPKSVHTEYAANTYKIGEINISAVLLYAGVTTVIIGGVLYWLINKTDLGLSIRATAENKLGAEIVGVNTTMVRCIVFGLGTALAMVAGVALIPMLFATPTATGGIFTLKAFVVTVLGGLGNISAAIAGGIILGLVEIWGTSYLSSEYREAYGLFVFLIILLLKPEGLFGKSIKRV